MLFMNGDNQNLYYKIQYSDHLFLTSSMTFQGRLYRPILIAGMVLLCACASNKAKNLEGLQIAVLSDVHLQDVHGKFQDIDYHGIKNPKDGKYALIRTMGSQLHSTRIFNENYFAFLTALDNVAQRNIKYVIMPGDYSDDGQAVHIRGLKKILEQYSKTYGISFFLANGNHDVVRPFGRENGKNDFLGSGGKPQPIMSTTGLYKPDPVWENPVIITKDIKNLGYSEITGLLGDFGFFPKKDHIYWETPFSHYDYGSYSFEKAERSSSLKNRSYTIPGNGIPVPDISYLVEPVNGLWLLALDGNTYLRKENAEGKPIYTNNGTGYNNVIKYRKYLIDWVAKVAEEAEKRGKKLIAFSHYPMVDFNDGATESINKLTIGEKLQIQRVPKEEVAQLFADAGLKIHFGGHMHINDTGVITTEKENTLINIQVPSLAAYLPAYKILTIGKNNIMDVETIVMDSVPDFDDFFELYEQEYKFLDSIGDSTIWNKKILTSKTYREFMDWHLRELVRLRFLKKEWPTEFKDFLLSVSGDELLALSQDTSNLPLREVLKKLRADTQRSSNYWKNAIKEAEENALSFKNFGEWSGFDLFLDLYRLRSADQLAFSDIGQDRSAAYGSIINSFLKNKDIGMDNDPLKTDMVEFMSIFKKFSNGAPSDHFEINLDTGEIFSIINGEHHKYNSYGQQEK